jgi:hypothetical protein
MFTRLLGVKKLGEIMEKTISPMTTNTQMRLSTTKRKKPPDSFFFIDVAAFKTGFSRSVPESRERRQ